MYVSTKYLFQLQHSTFSYDDDTYPFCLYENILDPKKMNICWKDDRRNNE